MHPYHIYTYAASTYEQTHTDVHAGHVRFTPTHRCTSKHTLTSRQTILPALQVGVSLVLSFMVVWDMPTIARGVESLRSSRLRAVYTEVAPTFTVFGQLFGKALQAQVTTAQPLHNPTLWGFSQPCSVHLALMPTAC